MVDLFPSLRAFQLLGEGSKLCWAGSHYTSARNQDLCMCHCLPAIIQSSAEARPIYRHIWLVGCVCLFVSSFLNKPAASSVVQDNAATLLCCEGSWKFDWIKNFAPLLSSKAVMGWWLDCHFWVIPSHELHQWKNKTIFKPSADAPIQTDYVWWAVFRFECLCFGDSTGDLLLSKSRL